jgi:CO/xanthine dehydrogenase FAD-binding subunit
VRSFVPDYELRTPAYLDEALQLMAREPGVWTPLAGGTDVMVLFEAGQLTARKLLNLWSLAELRGIRVTPAHVELGALTTYGDVQRHDVLRAEFPALCQAAAETGGIAIQNRGTLGGNIANASPAADTPPALLAYGAELELVSAGGSRWVPYDGFHVGYKKTGMRPDELVRTVRLARSEAPRRHFYRKVGTRKAQAISKVVLAGLAEIAGDRVGVVRLAVGSVGPTTLRLRRTEAVVSGQRLDSNVIAAARSEAEREVAPIDDVRSTAAFRVHVTGNLVERFLTEALP